ncbi:MAG: transcriptional regulator, partial [Spirosoma sp.]|nr:transcriptional regulator [Spirosoma sp.]
RRVADTLLNLHEQQPDGLIQLSREDLAAMVGTVTESVIRTLTEFKGGSFIQMTASGGIRVVEPDKLRAARW